MASMAFDIFARDHASRSFDKIGDNAERLGRRVEGAGSSTGGLSANLRGLSGAASGAAGQLGALSGSFTSMTGKAGQAADGIKKLELQLAQAQVAARRLGLAASEAAERAKVAGARASEAAELVKKGELSKEKAAALAAKAAIEQEKAEIAATNAQLARAKVAEKTAEVTRAYAKAQADATKETDRSGSSMRSLLGVAQGLGGALAGLGASLAKVGAGAAAFSVVGAGAASAAGYVVALSAAIAPLSGLLAALPGVALTGAAAFTTWKLATGGLGDAMSALMSGNMEQFSTILATLSEGGRAFVGEFQQIIPALQSFKAAAQDAFTGELAGSLAGFASALGGLKPAIAGLASEFGGIVRQGLQFATSAQSVSSFNVVLGNTSTLVGAVRKALDPLLRGFVDLGTVGSSWLAGLSGGLTDVLTKFGQWMTRIAESGQAWQWMDSALVVLKALGSIAKDVGDIISGIFNAARDAGTGALGVLGQIVDRFNAWVNSAQGQQVLVTIFQALDQVGRALVPVLNALGQAVALIAPEAAKVATALGPVLADAITILGRGIAAMGPGLVQMVEAFGRMVTAIGPLEPLGAAIGGIFAALGQALALIVPELAQIALALAPALTAALQALAPALAQLGPGLVAVAQSLAKAFADPAMQAGLLQLGKGIADILVAAAPLLPVIAQLAGILAQVLGGALTNLGVALGPIIAALATALEPALHAISRALNLLIPLMEPIYKAFGDIGAALIAELLPPLLNLIPVIIDSLIPAFAQLMREITPLIPILADLAVMFVQDVLPAIIPMIPQLSKLALEITKMGLVIAQLVADVAPHIQRFIGFFQRIYDVLVGHSIIPDLIGKIGEWLGKLPGMFIKWVGDAKDWAIRKFGELLTWVGGLPGRITSALGDMGSVLWQKGRDLAVGLWNGLASMANWLRDTIYNFFRSIMPDWVKNALGIASPSKVFAAIGKEIPAGMALGIDRASGLVESAVSNLAGMAQVGASSQVGVAGAGVPIAPQGGVTFVFNFAAQPLIGRDEITRIVVAALNDARARGFNLGFAS